jgi:NADH-quinone oxidoreductase subunit J
MSLTDIAFYTLSCIAIFAAVGVVAARNPVHSVLFLILTFFNAAGLFVLLGAEFLAMLLVVVYVGAVAVLFLFVVMMLDVDFVRLRQGFASYLPAGLVVSAIVLAEMVLVTQSAATLQPLGPVLTEENTRGIGAVLYTDYAVYVQMAGMILLVAMIGAIVLTLRHKPNVHRQNIGKQVARTPEKGMHVVSVKTGQGVEE